MLRNLTRFGLAALLCAAAPLNASILFVANLTGSQEVPPNQSTATGFGTVLLNDAMNQITVNESWTGLIGGPAAASHIHLPAPPGMNAPVVFPFSGVPAATSGSIPQQSFAITADQVNALMNGLAYMNVHNATFGGGEIRGILVQAAPEPGTWALLGIGVAGFALRRRRAKRAA